MLSGFSCTFVLVGQQEKMEVWIGVKCSHASSLCEHKAGTDRQRRRERGPCWEGACCLTVNTMNSLGDDLRGARIQKVLRCQHGFGATCPSEVSSPEGHPCQNRIAARGIHECFTRGVAQVERHALRQVPDSNQPNLIKTGTPFFANEQ